MRRHGATVAGTTLHELAFRTIYIARNAAMQIQAHGLGHVSPLNARKPSSPAKKFAAGPGRARLGILEGAARQGGGRLAAAKRAPIAKKAANKPLPRKAVKRGRI